MHDSKGLAQRMCGGRSRLAGDYCVYTAKNRKRSIRRWVTCCHGLADKTGSTKNSKAQLHNKARLTYQVSADSTSARRNANHGRARDGRQEVHGWPRPSTTKRQATATATRSRTASRAASRMTPMSKLCPTEALWLPSNRLMKCTRQCNNTETKDTLLVGECLSWVQATTIRYCTWPMVGRSCESKRTNETLVLFTSKQAPA